MYILVSISLTDFVAFSILCKIPPPKSTPPIGQNSIIATLLLKTSDSTPNLESPNALSKYLLFLASSNVDNNLEFEGIAKFGQYTFKKNNISEIKLLNNKPLKDQQTLLTSCNSHLIFGKFHHLIF